MKELSIFVDESGYFGKFNYICPYYIVTLVIHEQNNSIDKQIEELDLYLNNSKIGLHTIHTAPLIRKEKVYRDLNILDRFKIFDKLFHFIRKVDIKYKNIVIDKKYKKQIDINSEISKQLSSIVKNNLNFFRILIK